MDCVFVYWRRMTLEMVYAGWLPASQVPISPRFSETHLMFDSTVWIPCFTLLELPKMTEWASLSWISWKENGKSQWFQLSSNFVPYFIKPSLSILTGANVAVPGSKVNGTQTVKIRFCFNRRNSIQIQYTYAFWMSSHRLIKKSRAISFPIGLFATLLKTVLTSELKMPEVGSSNISSNLYFF